MTSRDRLYELVSGVSLAHPRDPEVQELCTLALELLCSGRPTLKQALGMAEQAGVSPEEAEAWWLSRESTDWMRGTVGGGILPVGKNHAADLKVFTLAVRSKDNGWRENGNGVNGHTKPKQDSIWTLKQSLEAVEEEIGRIDQKALYDGMGAVMKEKRAKLKERRADLRRKLQGLESY